MRTFRPGAAALSAGLGLLSACAPVMPPATRSLPATGAVGEVRLRLDRESLRGVQYAAPFSVARLSVDGPGMAAIATATASFAAGSAELTLSGVSSGPNRVVTLDGFASPGAPVPFARWATTVVVEANRVATASLGPSTTPRADVVMGLLSRDRAAAVAPLQGMAARVDATALQRTLDTARSQLGLAHPSLFDADAIASVLWSTLDPNAAPPVAPPTFDLAPYTLAPGRVRLTLAGLPEGATASVWLDDPVSPRQTSVAAGGVSISPVHPGTWTLTADAGAGLLATTSVTVGAGLDRPVDVKLDLGRWEAVTTTETLPTGAVCAPMSIAGKDYLVLAGGATGVPDGDGNTPFADSDVRAFDGTHWTRLPSMPEAIAYATGTVSRGKLWIFGGMRSDRSSSSTVYRFDGSQWTAVATLNNGSIGTPTVGAVCGELNGKILLFGGTSRRLALSFNPDTNAVTNAFGPSTDRKGAASAATETTFYVFGGAAGSELLASCESYDPLANHWRAIADLPVPRFGAQAIVVGDRIWLIGGVEANGRPSARVDRYVIAENRWESFPALGAPRGNAGVGLLASRLYVLGGADGLFFKILDGSRPEVPVGGPRVEVLKP